MKPQILAWLIVLSFGMGTPRPASAERQDASVAGLWRLNRELSQLPREIGFKVDWLPAGGSAQGAGGSGGRGGRGSSGGGAGAFTGRESEEDAKRQEQLTEEVRNPSARLAIVETPTAITITDDRGQSRTFHPDGKREVLQLDGVPVGVTTKREAGRLVVLYQVQQGRELRYTFLRTESPAQLVVDVQFVQRGGGDRVRRVYEPTSTTEASTPATPPAVPAGAPAKPDAALPPGGASSSTGAATPAGRPTAETFNQQPDAELKGLSNLGVVVEDLSSQAAACGLNQNSLATVLAKQLTDAGFKVRQNSDEDTYLYVNVITSSLSTGLCVSRYDAFLYTHTTAKLSYQETPVLVQVSLLHKGGIAGGAAANHGAAVLRGLQEYVEQFTTRIRDANKPR